MKDLCQFEHEGKKYVALVRKLTVRECFRLMGVEDDDTTKLLNAGIARTHMYKLAGNSIVVDVLYHIFRKLFVDTKSESLQLDLFDMGNDENLTQYNHDNPLKVVTLCSGYDSQCLAFERLKRECPPFDYELVAWSEFDPTSKTPLDKQPAVIAHNTLFPQWADRNLGDMTKIDWNKVSDFDMLFYSTPCFVAGTLVNTLEGLKPIEQVNVGDYVLTHTNTYKKVLEVGSKPSKEIIKIRAMMFDEILCTPNHPFYTREMYRCGHEYRRAFKQPTWKSASQLTKKDYLGFAINTKSELPSWNGTLLHRGTHFDASNNLSEFFNRNDFWYLMGRYIGDGWQRDDVVHKAICIATSPKKNDALIGCLNNLGLKYTLTKEITCSRITIYGKELCEFVSRYGKYAHGKHIDGETMNLPSELLGFFLKGYIDSDGCFAQGEYKITTVSRDLAYGLMQIVAKCLHRPSRIYKSPRAKKTEIEGRIVNQRDTYTIAWHPDYRKQDKAFYEDGVYWYPIKEIINTNICETVYNMEVEEDHSYTANGAIVHNCQSISQAGLQHGFVEGSGTRSSIIWNVRDALKIKKPKFACLENVAAMISQKFLPMFNLWQREVENLGYNNFAKVLNAKNYGVPQNRERIFLMSVRDDVGLNYSFPAQIPLKVTLPNLLQETVDPKYYLNPVKVNKFVQDNLIMIKDFIAGGNEPIEPLPDQLREFIENAEDDEDGAELE